MAEADSSDLATLLDGRRYELITLDGDGTLWDFELTMRRGLERSATQLSQRSGASTITARELERIRDAVASRAEHGSSSMEVIRRAAFAEAARLVGIDDDGVVQEIHDDYMRYRFEHLVHYPDVRPFLAAARNAGLELALVTNGNTTAAKAGLESFLDASFVAHDVGFRKPDPRLFRCVIDELAVAAERVIHIGDDPRDDVDASRAAGLTPIWLNRRRAAWPDDIAPAEHRWITFADGLS